MATTLKSWLDAGLKVPRKVESKLTFLPKLSTYMAKFDGQIPVGPSIYPDVPTAITTGSRLPLDQVFTKPAVEVQQAPLAERQAPVAQNVGSEVVYLGANDRPHSTTQVGGTTIKYS